MTTITITTTIMLTDFILPGSDFRNTMVLLARLFILYKRNWELNGVDLMESTFDSLS